MITAMVLGVVAIIATVFAIGGLVMAISIIKSCCSNEKEWKDETTTFLADILLFLGGGIIAPISIIGAIKLVSTGGKIFGYKPPVVLELVVFASLIAIIIAIKKCVNKRNENKDREKRLATIASGKWKFPVEEFYNQCIDQKITDTSSEFATKKMILIAKAIMTDNEIPKEHFHLYCTAAKVKKYYKDGNNISIVKAQKKKEAEELAWITPQVSSLTPEMLEHRQIVNTIKDLLYSEKKSAYLKLLIQSKKDVISHAEKTIEDIKTLCSALIESSQEKEINWATVGGLASGLGGIGAGIAAAQDAMIKNEEIKIKNQQIYDYYVAQYGPVYAEAQAKYQPIIEKAKSDVKKYNKLLSELPLKVYLENYDTQDLFKKLQVSGSISYVEEDCICTKIKITNHNVYEIDDQSFVIDGVLKTKLYCEDIFVDEFYVALPPNGISSKGSATVIQYPLKRMPGQKRSYRFEFSPHNLWLMEK